MQKTFLVTFFGRVQGVGFRYAVLHSAQKYVLTGWVRNSEKEEEVEALLQGEESQIQKLIDYFKSDSGLIRVNKVTMQEVKNSEKFNGFEVKY